MSHAPQSRHLGWYLSLLFGAALLAHFLFATTNWREGFMPGHEFRQTQTALIAYYVDQEDNFSIDYSVPILGKPWILPLEFPAYEWAVVALTRATGLPIHQAGRIISLGAFYLTLPALYLLLAQLGLPPPRRLFVLACSLVCPVYIFYARAILIDPTALMFSVWYLAAFTRMLRQRNWRWFAVCLLCGVAAGLIKSLVWFVWVVPAAAYGLWRLWQSWSEDGPPAAARTAAWGLGVMVVPAATAMWWSLYTDSIKASHSSAYIFTSANLARDNYGTFSLAAHLSSTTWKNLLTCWQQSLLPPWAFGLIVVPGLLFLPKTRRLIAGALVLFLAAQMTIPLAYALQDYYFYAANLFAVAAIAFTALGLLDTRLPRWLVAPLLPLPLAALFATYHADYFQLQSVKSNGGSGLTEALRAYTPPDSVLIVAGNDWAPIIPYYAQRKALMIRAGLDNDPAYLDRAFGDLHDEEVAALVVSGPERNKADFIRRTTRAFNLDPTPTFTHPFGDVYISNFHRELTLRRLHENHGYNQVTTQAPPLAMSTPQDPSLDVPTGSAPKAFDMVHPAPSRYRFAFGYDIWTLDGDRCLNMHAESDLEIPAPASATTIHWDFGLVRDAYERAGGRTNGVEFIIVGTADGHPPREIFRRLLDPAAVPADRGPQSAAISFTPRPGEQLRFQTRHNGTPAFDWSYTRRIVID